MSVIILRDIVTSAKNQVSFTNKKALIAFTQNFVLSRHICSADNSLKSVEQFSTSFATYINRIYTKKVNQVYTRLLTYSENYLKTELNYTYLKCDPCDCLQCKPLPPPKVKIKKVKIVAAKAKKPLSRSTKYKRAKKIQNADFDSIMLAAIQTFKKHNFANAAYVLSKIIKNPVSLGMKMANFYDKGCPEPHKPKMLVAPEALNFLLQTDLTQKHYNFVKSTSDSMNASFLPNYNIVLDAKKECYPEGIEISDNEYVVPVDGLVINTLKSIYKDPEMVEMTKKQCDLNGGNLEILFDLKAGTDGLTSMKKYNRKPKNDDRNRIELISYFSIHIVV